MRWHVTAILVLDFHHLDVFSRQSFTIHREIMSQMVVTNAEGEAAEGPMHINVTVSAHSFPIFTCSFC